MIKEKNFLNWFLLIFWMGIIFFLSSQSDLRSGLESQMDFILRKIAHITEYAILTFLAWRVFGGWQETRFPLGNLVFKAPQTLIYAVIFSVLYAISDEYHQVFTYLRVGSLIDVLIDSAGIMIMAAAIWKKEIRKL